VVYYFVVGEYGSKTVLLFSSPEPQAEVSYSDYMLSVVRLSVNFSFKQLFFQNKWTDFNQMW